MKGTLGMERMELRSNRLAAGWLLLALAAIGLSTLCALLLVIARAPVLGNAAASRDLFRSALVLHVGLAVVVWFLSCAAGFWAMAAKQGSARDWIAFTLSAAGVVAMVVSPATGASTPVLANYLPVLDDPIFLAGLACFLIGIAASASSALCSLLAHAQARAASALRSGAILSILALLSALAIFASSLAQHGMPHGAAAFETLGWGAGHALQFVHVLLMMSVWGILADAISDAASNVAPIRRMLPALLFAAALPLLVAPIIQASYPIGSPEYRRAFTLLMAWGAWPAPAALGLCILWRMRLAGLAALRNPQAIALLLSIVLFLLGCVFGASIRAESTMVPAHYHGTVGAVTLAYMALGYRLLPIFGVATAEGRLIRWQPIVYGAGLIVLASGLAWSGWMGIPRKTPHADIVAHYPAYYVAMSMAVLGGALAVTGAGLFVVNMLRNLRGTISLRPLRWFAGAVAGTAMAAGLFACKPTAPDPVSTSAPASALTVAPEVAAHAAHKRQEEIDARFNAGASLLAAKQYEAAANELHRLLELAPDMPEAHVNMGYAMIGMQRYTVARDFFDTAINLRTNQTNAYFGLALALEGLNDYGGALGAMRSYVHLSKSDDPFLRKANSAIWEWEEALKKARSGMTVHGPVIPENGNVDQAAPKLGKKPG
jgi:cytochrome c oxidase subunit I